MSHLLLADAEPMSAMLGSGLFKNLMTLLLVVIAVMALVMPSLLAKAKSALLNVIDAKLQAILPPGVNNALHAVTDGVVSPVTGLSAVQPAGTVSTIVQQRANELRTCCPGASSDLRLKWLEQGLDPSRAQSDYISVLEKQLANVAVDRKPLAGTKSEV